MASNTARDETPAVAKAHAVFASPCGLNWPIRLGASAAMASNKAGDETPAFAAPQDAFARLRGSHGSRCSSMLRAARLNRDRSRESELLGRSWHFPSRWIAVEMLTALKLRPSRSKSRRMCSVDVAATMRLLIWMFSGRAASLGGRVCLIWPIDRRLVSPSGADLRALRLQSPAMIRMASLAAHINVWDLLGVVAKMLAVLAKPASGPHAEPACGDGGDAKRASNLMIET